MVLFFYMNTKILASLVLGVVVMVSVAYFVLAPYAKTIEDAESDAYAASQKQRVTEGAFAPQFPRESSTTSEIEEAKTAEQAVTPAALETKPAVTPKPVPVPVPVTKPTPVPTPTPAASLYTAQTVAVHNSETSCWSIINGVVYDLTSFVSRHPGGDRNILKICGKDGSSAFMGQHGGDSKPESTLAKYYLGQLSQ
jgi:cytochrome b involved in lipid metabolism